ncbi:unnamed protein product, partial [Heterotrigona itama]
RVKLLRTKVYNCQNCYKPGLYRSIDEQLFPTKANSRFTRFMLNKPNKFGIKFWLASAVKSKYTRIFGPTRGVCYPEISRILHRLWKKYYHGQVSYKGVISDKTFSKKQTTLVGTIRGNGRELPKLERQIKDNTNRFSTTLYGSNNCNRTIYKAKPNKKTPILGSMHSSVKIEKKVMPVIVQ